MMRRSVILVLCTCVSWLRAQIAPVNTSEPNGFIRIVTPGVRACGTSDRKPAIVTYFVAAVSEVTKAVTGTSSLKDGSFVLLPQLVGRGNWNVTVLDDLVDQVSVNKFLAQGGGQAHLIDRPYVCVVDPRESGSGTLRSPGWFHYLLEPESPEPQTLPASLRGEIFTGGTKPVLARVKLYGLAAHQSAMVE